MTEGNKIKINRRKVEEKPAELKEEQNIQNLDLEVPSLDEVQADKQTKQNSSVIKEQKVEKRKLFANKKANIALGVLMAIIILVFAVLAMF